MSGKDLGDEKKVARREKSSLTTRKWINGLVIESSVKLLRVRALTLLAGQRRGCPSMHASRSYLQCFSVMSCFVTGILLRCSPFVLSHPIVDRLLS